MTTFRDSRNQEHAPLLLHTNRDIEDIENSYDKHTSHWEFPGWGSVSKLNVQVDKDKELATSHKHDPSRLLGQWAATSIAGNDITSSCLYVAGSCAAVAGQYAPISLIAVAIVLYLFRNIYSEVGTALPLNGGAYNVLLNSTSKLVAAFAACLTLVSYVATAVVSATSAIAYAKNLWQHLDPHWAVVALLGVFAFMTLMGLKESSAVALVIFVIHISTMMLLIILCVVYLIQKRDMSLLKENWNQPLSSDYSNVVSAVFFGYCAALLGVSGFETSANYVEEQKPGVFPKTLRNMWYLVAFFNPCLSFLAICVLPVAIINNKSKDLLAAMAMQVVPGKWLNIVVSVDAFLVLSGAILTGYVGITGLVSRMSLDRCLPMFLVKENSIRHTAHFIILGFFFITSYLYVIVGGDTESLEGVYTIAFLGVMALFAAGNMILKYKRSMLHRDVTASWPAVVVGFLAVVSGMVGTIYKLPGTVIYFIMYFGVTLAIVMLMFGRKKVIKMLAYFTNKLPFLEGATHKLQQSVKDIENHPMVFFAKSDDPSTLNKAILYVRDNELTNWLQIVHVYKTEDRIPADLETNVMFLDKQYPKLCIDLVLVEGTFDPATVHEISHLLQVPKNFMFITCPGDHFPHGFADLGGLRLITH
eukprot:TRINITY_DN8784_c0_g1_i1.p1 TRINITY_DN8784_c0_g1~~TRINITY_DN8784_c0_g1_i1.p1  ORF type:complete len:644 (+),score=213.44 TRINITY_DN8784_c0_g1_i1:346-2277(+)